MWSGKLDPYQEWGWAGVKEGQEAQGQGVGIRGRMITFHIDPLLVHKILP